MHVCMHACMHACMYVRMYVRMCVGVYIHTHMHMCVQLSVYPIAYLLPTASNEPIQNILVYEAFVPTTKQSQRLLSVPMLPA